jgi:AraC-like DNA-binding protein
MFYELKHLGSPHYLKVEKGENFSFPMHLHHCFEVIVVLSGEMKITIDNTAYSLKSREALLIFPNQIHSLESTQSQHVLCIFSPRLVQAYATGVKGKIPVDNKLELDSYLIEAVNRLTLDSTTAEKKGILYSVCSSFEKSAVYTNRRNDNEKLLLRIFSFVENEFDKDCTLSSLSEQIGYDYSYISRFFKKNMGISFNTYVNYYRLSHACYLMENTDLPILQCAMDSGYTSLRSFNRNFKEHFNVTPAMYRRNISD